MTEGKEKMARKARRRHEPDWFKRDRYTWTRELLETDPVLLYQEFRLRADAMDDAEIRERMMPFIMSGDGRLTKQQPGLEGVKIEPEVSTIAIDTDLVTGNKHPFLIGTPALTALSCRDVSLLLQQSSPTAIPPPTEHSPLGKPTAQVGGPFSGKAQVMHIRDKLSIDTHRYSRNPNIQEAEYAVHCKIDLEYPDEVIIQSLKRVLPQWRKNLGSVTGQPPSNTDQANAELAKISSLHLIEVMDLKLWESHTGSKLTIRDFIRLIYKNGDYGEEIFRKTTLSNLRKFMRQDMSRKLYAAAFTKQAIVDSSVQYFGGGRV